MSTTTTPPADGMSDSWRDHALLLRGVLKKLGAPMRGCLPGDEDDCGSSWAEHALSYWAAIQARAEYGLRHMHHGEPGGERLAGQLVGHWREEFDRTDPCDAC